MKKQILKLTALFFFAALFTLTSCRDDADTQSAEDAARGSFMMADAFAIANDGSGNGKALNARFEGCTVDAVPYGDNGYSITFDHCADEDGLIHNGTIRFSVTGEESSNDNGWAKIVITFDNYTVEDEGIDGEVSAIVKFGIAGLYFEVGARNLELKSKNGDKVTYDSASLRYVFGVANGFKLTISGESEGTDRNGKHFKTESENVRFSIMSTNNDKCSGTMTVTVDGEPPLTINYDTGECGEMEVSQKGKKKKKITLF